MGEGRGIVDSPPTPPPAILAFAAEAERTSEEKRRELNLRALAALAASERRFETSRVHVRDLLAKGQEEA